MKTITDKDRENIQIARELKELTEMPGWKHLEKLKEMVSLQNYVGPEELKIMITDNLLAYKVGKKDGIVDFFKQINIAISQGGQIVNDINTKQKAMTSKIKDMQEMDQKHGYF